MTRQFLHLRGKRYVCRLPSGRRTKTRRENALRVSPRVLTRSCARAGFAYYGSATGLCAERWVALLLRPRLRPAKLREAIYTSPTSAKLSRSASSPSPPSARNASGRADSARRPFLNVRSSRRRLGSFGADVAPPDGSNVDLSSTYHAGSSRYDHVLNSLSNSRDKIATIQTRAQLARTQTTNRISHVDAAHP